MEKKLYIQPRMDWEETVIMHSLLEESPLDLNDNEDDEVVDDFEDLLDKSRREEPSETTMTLW